MAEHRDIWSAPPPGGMWPPADAQPPFGPPSGPPSGLFSGPTRPVFREPHPIRAGALWAGLGSGALWLLLIGLLAQDLRGYAWFTLLGGAAAWAVAVVLARVGDRGVAVGVAISTGVGWSIAAFFVAARWAATADWPMW
jgi:hypothetical protein